MLAISERPMLLVGRTSRTTVHRWRALLCAGIGFWVWVVQSDLGMVYAESSGSERWEEAISSRSSPQ
jgi:hypothetical protein